MSPKPFTLLPCDDLPRLVVEAAGESDRGRVRRRNEDSFVVGHGCGLYAVADGVSGREHGDIASRTAIECVSQFVTRARGDESSAAALLDAAVRDANHQVYVEGLKQGVGRGMTTTFVGALVRGSEVCLAHVGDSRAYRLRHARLSQLTVDHSVANEMFASRRPDDQRMLGVNLAALTRAVGLQETIDVTIQETQMEAGDVLLLCSDGLYNMLEPYEIVDILRREQDLGLCVEGLISAANALGGFDNITVVLVRFREEQD